MSTGGASELLQGDPVGGPAVGEEPTVDTVEAIAAKSPMQLFWRRLREDKVALVALGFIVMLVLVAIFAPLIVKLVGAAPPNEQNDAALDEFGSAAPPGNGYIMGTDDLGRDIFSRVLYGARISLAVAFISTTLIVLIGVTLGMLAGYYRGWVDTVLSRAMDVMLAFPVLLLALGLGAACSLGDGCIAMNNDRAGTVLLLVALLVTAFQFAWFAVARRREGSSAGKVRPVDIVVRVVPGVLIAGVGLVFLLVLEQKGALIQPGLPVVIFVITLAGWPYMARIIRGQVLSLREKEFVEAAQSLGASDGRILFRHVLPNLVAPIIVYATLLIPQNILFEAALSFLGVGVQPPTASWGAMIADATSVFDTAWWYMTFPGLALLLTVLAFNLVGDGLQDAINPRSRR